MIPLVLHLMEVAKISRIPRSSGVNATKAIKEKIATISTNAKIVLVNTVESVIINLEHSNATAKTLDMKGPHVRIHAMLSRMIAKMEENVKIKMVLTVANALAQALKEKNVRSTSMNVRLASINVKTRALAKTNLVPMIAIVIALILKGNIAKILCIVSTVFPDNFF